MVKSKQGMNQDIKISVVLPVYRNEAMLEELCQRLLEVMKQLNAQPELIFVNDASPDNSWEIIKSLAAKHPEVRGLNLSKNFGQHYAISAGLAHSNGDWVVVMDADLQDVPEEITKLYKEALRGYDIVLAQRQKRKDSWLKKRFSLWFYKLLSYLSGAKYDGSVANYGIYNRKVVAAIVDLPEKNRYFPSMVKWVGFHSTSIAVNHASRESGSSAYNWKKRTNLALDIILSYSDKPLRLAIKLGVLMVILSSAFAIWILIRWIKGDIVVEGYTSLLLSIWFLSGILILVLGVSGLYIGKIFENVKDRPTYIVKEEI